MIRLEDVHLFIRSALLGSFSAAAREASLLPAQVSAAIRRLERDLDTRLFARSTRSLRLTAEGEKYLPFAREMLSAMQAGAESLRTSEQDFQGELKIAMPSDVGRNVLLPVITDFCRIHPRISLRLFLSDHVSDIFRDPVDIAIRYGVLNNRDYVALPLAPENRRVLVASPAYLDEHGRPESLEDILHHPCLAFTLNNTFVDKWSFPVNGAVQELPVAARLLCDDADVARRWAIEGMGIVYKSWLDVCHDVQNNRLEVVLPDQAGETAPLNLICPHRKQFSPAIRTLHSNLKEHLAAITRALDHYTGFGEQH